MVTRNGRFVALGFTLSSTVTTAVAVLEFPCTSVTVSVTVFSPTSLQSKEVISKAYVSIPQLSVDPFSICEETIEAAPFASS